MAQPTIALREITEDTVNDILALEVAPDQTGFVAANARSIAQAYYCENAWFRAIYADDTPVGFVMLYIDNEKPEYFLWRFMIDAKYQKRNYGLQAMELVIQYVRTFPNATRLELSYAPGEGDPSGFYAKLGFVETGEWLDKQKVMRLTL